MNLQTILQHLYDFRTCHDWRKCRAGERWTINQAITIIEVVLKRTTYGKRNNV